MPALSTTMKEGKIMKWLVKQEIKSNLEMRLLKYKSEEQLFLSSNDF
jgi:hypothetical protein